MGAVAVAALQREHKVNGRRSKWKKSKSRCHWWVAVTASEGQKACTGFIRGLYEQLAAQGCHLSVAASRMRRASIRAKEEQCVYNDSSLACCILRGCR